MRRIKFLLPGILLVLYCQVYCQQKTKVVTFGSDEKIEEMKATDNYVAIRTSTPSYTQTKAYLFDNNGNKLFEKSNEGGGSLLQSEVSEPLGCFIVCTQGNEGTEGYPGIDGIIKAYDIKTGNEMWQVISNADWHKMSPDCLRMLTQAPPVESGPSGSRFTINNLKDGSTVAHNLKLNGWDANWLDNERIVIAIEQMVKNPDGKELREEIWKKKRATEILEDSLVQKRLKYYNYLRAGEKTKEECEKIINDLTVKIYSIKEEVKKETKRNARRSVTPSEIRGASKLMIYNINTLQVETEKDIYANDGEPIIIRDDYLAINIERASQDIYLYARKGKHNALTACIVRLDKSLNVKTLSSIGAGNLKKTNVGDEIYFQIDRREDGQFIVDKETGKLIPNQKIKTKLGEIELDFNSSMEEKMFTPDVRVQENGKALEFSLKEERQ